MNGIIYLVQVNVYLFAFYAFYRLILSRETFFGLNRFYLIGSTLLAFGIPVVQSDWVKDWLAPEPIQNLAMQVNLQAYEFLVVPATEVTLISVGDVITWLYMGVAGFLLVRLVYRLFSAYRWVRNPQNGLQACSFFNYIAVDENLEGREAIMIHEQVHVQQIHSADILFFELNVIVNWFNPVAYLLKEESRKVHEYIADAEASRTLAEKSAYAMLLFNENFGVKSQQLTNSFFNQSILKQRIMMLQKNKSKKVALVKYGFIVPLFLGMLMLSSAFVSKQTSQQVAKSVLADTIPNPPIPASPPKTQNTKTAPNLGNNGGNDLIYIVNGKEVSVTEVKKIDKNKIATIDIKGPVKGRKKSAMVIQLKPATTDGDSSATQQKDTKEQFTWVEGEKLKEGVIVIKANTKTGDQSDSNKPLIVIDGKVVEAGFDMNSIKPNDIASVSILKDKSATAVYGEKAKNGVVEITLKKKN